MDLYLIVAIVSIVVMSVIAYVVGRKSVPTDAGTRLELEKQRLESQLNEKSQEVADLRTQLSKIQENCGRYQATAEQLEEQLKKSQNKFDEEKQALKDDYKAQLSEFKDQLKDQLKTQSELIHRQMKETSEEVLRNHQKELADHNGETMKKLVDPLNLNIKTMQELFEKTSKTHADSITRLDEAIKLNMDRSQELGERAERLANALTGEVKVQGNFGELKLKQLFEDLGLREGEQYSTQEALVDRYGKKIKSEEDKRLIPDFILHFPNNRDVVVDSKVNITAFESYMNSDNADEKTAKLKEHITSVRNQVDILAKKDYSRYLDTEHTKLNFVIMYMFHEGALNLALQNDTGLWRYAYDKGVLILGPQTMYMNLRILELMWVQSRQLSNQREMVEEAEKVVKRVQLFVERFNAVKKSVDNTTKLIKDLDVTTDPKGQSIIVAAKKLIACGAKEDKSKVSLSTFIDNDDESMMIPAPQSKNKEADGENSSSIDVA